MNLRSALTLDSIIFAMAGLTLLTVIWSVKIIVIKGVPLYFLFSIFSIFFLILTNKDEKYKIQINELYILFFMFWLMTSIIIAPNIFSAVQQYYYYIISFSLFFIIKRSVFSVSSWYKLSNYFLIGGLVVSVAMTLSWKLIFDNNRVDINGINPNYLAYSLITILPILYIKFRDGRIDILFYSMLAIVSIAIFLTGSRGALISLFIYLFIIGIKKPLLGISIIILIIFFSSVIIGLYDSLPQYWQLRFDFNNATGSSIDWSSGRDDTWMFAWQLIKENYIFGIGLNNFGFVTSLSIGVHNAFLSLLVETGIIGFLLFFMIFVSILFTIYKVDKTIAAMIFLIELPILLTGIWESSPVLWCMLSLVVAYVKLVPKKSYS